jgi:hypothetical protein
VLLVVTTTRTAVRAAGAERSGAGATSHRSLIHAILRRVVHRGRIAGISDNCSACTAGAATKTAHIFGKVVISTDLITTLPVTSTEWHHTTAAHTTATVAHGAVVTTVRGRGHHGGGSIAKATSIVVVVTSHIVRGTSTDGGERASETGSSALEVGETAGRASPVTGSRTVLARREGGQDVLCAVKHTAGGGWDLNGLLIKGTAIHTKALSSLLMGREYGESSACGLMLLRGSKSPEGNGPATKLGEPTLKLGLGCVVGETRHVKNLAPLGKEGSNIGSSIHGSSQNIRVLLGRLGLSDQASKNSSKSDGLFHGTSWRGRGKSLQVEWEVMLDRCTRLDGLDLESGANIGEHRRSEWQRFGVVLLPALVLGTEIKSARVL